MESRQRTFTAAAWMLEILWYVICLLVNSRKENLFAMQSKKKYFPFGFFWLRDIPIMKIIFCSDYNIPRNKTDVLLHLTLNFQTTKKEKLSSWFQILLWIAEVRLTIYGCNSLLFVSPCEKSKNFSFRCIFHHDENSLNFRIIYPENPSLDNSLCFWLLCS